MNERYMEYVDTTDRDEALMRLQERVNNGEDLYKVIGIDKANKYYVDKILARHVDMSITVYNRIMGLPEKIMM